MNDRASHLKTNFILTITYKYCNYRKKYKKDKTKSVIAFSSENKTKTKSKFIKFCRSRKRERPTNNNRSAILMQSWPRKSKTCATKKQTCFTGNAII